MMSPARSPVINPVKGHSGYVGVFGRWTSNTEETLSPGTETPQPVDKKEEKRKSRNLLKKGKRSSTKAF
jgi:hypothetical protein